jgi:hypothetical protein
MNLQPTGAHLSIQTHSCWSHFHVTQRAQMRAPGDLSDFTKRLSVASQYEASHRNARGVSLILKPAANAATADERRFPVAASLWRFPCSDFQFARC